MGHVENVFAITRPPLSGYRVVPHPGIIVETYHSSAGMMRSQGDMHRISVNRTSHARYSFRFGDACRTVSVARPKNTLCLQPATIPLFVDGDAADYISIFLAPEAFRDASAAAFRPEGMEGAALMAAADPVTLNVALALSEATRSPQLNDPLVAEQLGSALAACVVRLLSGGHGDAPQRQRPLAMSRQRLRRVLDHIDASLDGPDLSIARLAAVAGMSAFHFCRSFKSETGTSPHRFVLERRILRAKALLTRSHTTMAEIAYAVGFSSQAHFSTVFRRATGVTPSHYRDDRSS